MSVNFPGPIPVPAKTPYPQEPIYGNMFSDMGQVAQGVGQEAINFQKGQDEKMSRDTKIQDMIERRKQALAVQQAREDYQNKNMEFKEEESLSRKEMHEDSQAEKKRQFDAEQSRRAEDAKLKAENRKADIERQKARDEATAEHRSRTLEAQRRWSNTINRKSVKHMGRVVQAGQENIDKGLTTPDEIVRESKVRLEKIQAERDSLDTELGTTGPGTKGELTDSASVKNWFADYEEDTDKGMAKQKRRGETQKKRIQLLDKGISDFQEAIDYFSGGGVSFSGPGTSGGTDSPTKTLGKKVRVGDQTLTRYNTPDDIKAAKVAGEIMPGDSVWVDNYQGQSGVIIVK